LGAVRRRTMICCRNVKISASIAARDRNSSTTAQTMSLTRSLITDQHRPILGQPPANRFATGTGGGPRAAGPPMRMLPWSVVSRPLEGEAPTIDLAVGYSKANTSPLLKLFLSRIDDLTARISSKARRMSGPGSACRAAMARERKASALNDLGARGAGPAATVCTRGYRIERGGPEAPFSSLTQRLSCAGRFHPSGAGLEKSVPELAALRKLRKIARVVAEEQRHTAAFELLHAHACR
jgi:hypothetical protein